ncbi:lytic murein transglycosylase [Alteraurantiacibacter aquimixticola]|uniref:Lytic murein transglycosylase n=1 Tax=Alteraurantiacibacter aquimixticola TaxID=2489173 RepID=A0A4T3F0K8_9SPHN|nr:lytic murein transglycosylase [Alteraurantiacibacter aquimixticola]TIX50057.1 lytic murein transglycosylase [Alteraurantiacibacter aquimixticola]
MTRTAPLRRAMIAAAASLALLPAAAAAQSESFSEYLDQVEAKALSEGVSQRTITAVFAGMTPNNRVIELDQGNVSQGSSVNPATGFAWMSSYINRHNTQARINGGVSAMRRVASLAGEVERTYGVPAEILVAIWGHETAYGVVKGGFDLPRSLATLAWEGRRRDLFERELIDVLKIADSGVPRETLVGSWAGAFGNPQFLPSVYLRLAVDGDGDGDRDIWNSDADTLHSIANYFHDAGWRTGQPWGVRAYVPNSVDRAAIESDVTSPVCPRVHERHSKWMTVREWRALGVEPRGPIGDDVMVSLFEPDGPAYPGYLLTQNYRVILEYNCSNYYAMSVGLLADEISR